MNHEGQQAVAAGLAPARQESTARAGSRSQGLRPGTRQSWPEYLDGVSLFDNAVRLRFFIWTLQRYLPPGARLLEVGFGSGTTAVLLADLGYYVTACDLEPELVSRLRSKYSDWLRRDDRLSVRQADMFKLPWADKTFDSTYHQGVLEHFSDDQIIAALREQARVARYVVFDVPNHRFGVQPFGDERLLSPRHWRRLIQRAELELLDERGSAFPRRLYWLPYALISHRALEVLPYFGRRFGICSIFVCRSTE